MRTNEPSMAAAILQACSDDDRLCKAIEHCNEAHWHLQQAMQRADLHQPAIVKALAAIERLSCGLSDALRAVRGLA